MRGPNPLSALLSRLLSAAAGLPLLLPGVANAQPLQPLQPLTPPPLLLAPLPPAPPPPSPPPPSPSSTSSSADLPTPFAPDDAEGVRLCVPRFGHAGCAAHLYAQLLCAVVGDGGQPLDLQSQLDRQFAEAGIDFSGLAPTQIETEAVQEQVPQICPGRSPQILQLFSTLSRSASP